MDASLTYCGAHFAVYTNIESFCCLPETNIILHVNFLKKGKTSLSNISNIWVILGLVFVDFLFP